MSVFTFFNCICIEMWLCNFVSIFWQPWLSHSHKSLQTLLRFQARKYFIEIWLCKCRPFVFVSHGQSGIFFFLYFSIFDIGFAFWGSFLYAVTTMLIPVTVYVLTTLNGQTSQFSNVQRLERNRKSFVAMLQGKPSSAGSKVWDWVCMYRKQINWVNILWHCPFKNKETKCRHAHGADKAVTAYGRVNET